jgi:quercetin dioxygenase-like cupin family protein
MKKTLLVVAAALLGAGIAVAAPKPAAPITAHPLALARVAKPFTVHAAGGRDLLFLQATVEPGGNFGWHTHRSAVAVAVLAGTLTLYDSGDRRCAAQRIEAGRGFVEPPNHIHLARNEGTKAVRLMIAYLGAPRDGRSPDVPAARPAHCASVE